MTEYEFLKLAVKLRCAYIRLDTKHLDIFECVDEVFKGYQEVRTRMLEFKLCKSKIEGNELKNKSISQLEISVRTFNCLKSNNIETIQQLLDYDDFLLKLPNFGKKSFNELSEALGNHGLKLKHDTYKYD